MTLKRPRKPRFLRQGVQLTGFNTPIFQSYMTSLHEIHDLLSRQFPERSLEEFKPDNFITYSSLNFATRYFTSRHDDPHCIQVPFASAVDPKGILASMQNDNYIHAADNSVLYYMLYNKMPPQYVNQFWHYFKLTQLSIKRFQATMPTNFRIGDIVEVQTTIIAVPIKDRHFKMIHQLRSIALINSNFSQVSIGTI